MKKIFYLMALVLTMSVSACNNQPVNVQIPEEDTIECLQWQAVDSITSNINLNDSACITLTFEDSVLVFETQGITEFKIFNDSTEIAVDADSNVYRVAAEDNPVRIQADSTEIEL